MFPTTSGFHHLGLQVGTQGGGKDLLPRRDDWPWWHVRSLRYEHVMKPRGACLAEHRMEIETRTIDDSDRPAEIFREV